MLATTTIQEEDVYSLLLHRRRAGERRPTLLNPRSPLTLAPLVPRGAREKISGGCIKMHPTARAISAMLE